MLNQHTITPQHTLHPLAWIAWVAAACVILSATRNPLHLLIAVLCIVFTMLICAPQGNMLRFALIILLSSTLINLLIARTGTTILFALPTAWPLIGGIFSLESLVYGLLTGLALTGIILAFRSAHAGIPTRALLDLLPAAFAPLAVTLTIAVAFVPATLRHLRQVREAQAVRGHRLRGLGDWLALLMPLLIGGLDRSLQLAETLAARGFPQNSQQRRIPTILIAFGLACCLAGLLLGAWRANRLATGVVIVGLGMLLAAIWQTNHTLRRTRYRRVPWRLPDSLIVVGAVCAMVAFVLPVAAQNPMALFYSPYPSLMLPDFHPLIGLATLGLLGPGIVSGKHRAESANH